MTTALAFRPVRRGPSPASMSDSSRSRRSDSIPPLGLAALVLSTLAAVPIFLGGGGSEATTIEVHAALTTLPAHVTAPLLEEIETEDLFDAGAKEDALDVLAQEPRASLISPSRPTPTESRPGADTSPTPTTNDPVAADSASTDSGAVAPTTAPANPPESDIAAPSTTAVPSTEPPSTDPPSTDPPTTEPPTTEPPVTQPAAEPSATAPPAPEPAPVEAPAVESGASEPAPTPAADPVAPSQPTAAQWEVLRQCESGGNYTIVSRNGLYHGAYQFSVQTWDRTAQASGLGHLAGVLPSQASPADQDTMALGLWNLRGWAPWPSCGKKAAAA